MKRERKTNKQNARQNERIKAIELGIKEFEKKVDSKIELYSKEIEKIKEFSSFFLDKVDAFEKKFMFIEKRLRGLETLISKIDKVGGDKEELIQSKLKKNEISIHMLENQISKFAKRLAEAENRIRKTEAIQSEINSLTSSLSKDLKNNAHENFLGNTQKGSELESFDVLLDGKKVKEILDEISVIKDRIGHLERGKADSDYVEKIKATVEVLNKRLEELMSILLEKA